LRIVAVVVDCDITAVPIHIGMSFRLSWLLCLFKFSLYASSQSMAIGRHLHSLHSEWKCFETNDFCIPCETRHVGKDACTLGPCRFAMEQCNFFLSVLIFAQLWCSHFGICKSVGSTAQVLSAITVFATLSPWVQDSNGWPYYGSQHSWNASAADWIVVTVIVVLQGQHSCRQITRPVQSYCLCLWYFGTPHRFPKRYDVNGSEIESSWCVGSFRTKECEGYILIFGGIRLSPECFVTCPTIEWVSRSVRLTRPAPRALGNV
jgi:hypothetical protein